MDVFFDVFCLWIGYVVDFVGCVLFLVICGFIWWDEYVFWWGFFVD